MRRRAVVAPAVLAAAVRLVVGAGECVLHEDRGDHTFARAKNCEEAVLDGELARFCAHAPSGGDDAIAYAHRALAKQAAAALTKAQSSAPAAPQAARAGTPPAGPTGFPGGLDLSELKNALKRRKTKKTSRRNTESWP